MARHAMIMAGGSGTRLWPLSRAARPKQLLPIVKSDADWCSLLEVSAARLDGVVEPPRRLICTGEQFRSAIRGFLPEFTDDQILGEPVGRDSINAVGLTAAVLAQHDPDAIFAVLTSDHVITPQEVFRERMDEGFRLVEADPSRLVTFSITPTFPATSYGYVHVGEPINGFSNSSTAKEFVEKPDPRRAEQYLQSGDYGWNSGMFVFHARTLMKALERFVPESFAGLTRVANAWATPTRAQVLAEVYPTLPRTSVDYGIMEPASQDPDFSICCVDLPVQWLDVGSWPSYAQTLQPDENANCAGPSNNAIFQDSKDCLVVAEDDTHTIALLGCENLVVVHTPDATLVMPKHEAEALKQLHANLPDSLK